MLVLSSVVFALQATAVTPLSGSTSSQHIETQQARTAESLLAAEAANGTVKDTVRYWNPSAGRFHDAGRRGYQHGGPPTAFGAALDETFLDRGVAFNVNLYAVAADGTRNAAPVRLVYLGEPSDHASAATTRVALFDDDRLLEPDGSEGDRVADANYFAADIDPDGPLYTVVEVEVIAWRM
ncbi:DUF7288 family protein [Haloferacaceae archaeon DSL9]